MKNLVIDILIAREGSLLAILSWICVFFISFILYLLIIRPIWYKTTYSKMIYTNCKVTNKDHYTTTSTTFIKSGNVTVPIQHTHHHYEVKLKCDNLSIEKDDSSIYESVELGQMVKVGYKNSYISPRFYEGKKEFDGIVVESVR